MKYLLALDQGTTSSRAILFDHAGAIVAVGQKEFHQHYPRPGWVEHAPAEIWQSQIDAIDQALAAGRVSAGQISAIGITNQRETTLIWDRHTGEPVYNAIVWQDRRTAGECDRMREEGMSDVFQRKTGLLLDPYFSGTKIRWILEHVDGARARAERGALAFGTVDTWLIWKLTDGRKHVTDATNASRTLLCNIERCAWDDELLAPLGVPRGLLPEIVSSSGVCGGVSRLESLAGVPIAGIAGDQQAALFGQACFQAGMAKNTYGTGCFLLMNTGPEPVISQNKLLTTVAWKIGPQVEYALEGSVFIGGAVVQWLRDELHMVESAGDVERLAGTVEDTGGVYMVPAFSGLGAPHWDPYARGLIIGITRGTNSAHLARAALESIAFQVGDVLDAMRADSGIDLVELRVDGGASLNALLLQFQADLLQAPVVRPKVAETTALGAAYLAGLAVGYWESREEIAELWDVDVTCRPARDPGAMDAARSRWRDAVERSRGWEPRIEAGAVQG